jgi:hypothetical protein
VQRACAHESLCRSGAYGLAERIVEIVAGRLGECYRAKMPGFPARIKGGGFR